MKHILAKFKKIKGGRFNHVYIFTAGSHIVIPIKEQDKKQAIESVKAQLHKMIDEL